MTEEAPSTTSQLELRTALGPVYRTVLNVPPRDCTAEEIPIIDISRLFSPSLDDRKALAAEIGAAAENNGFFYIKNHGVPEETIMEAKKQCLAFFHQPLSHKTLVSQSRSRYFNGYKSAYGTRVNASESWDTRESLSWRYAPSHDPTPKPTLSQIPAEVLPWLRGEEFVWEGTAEHPGPGFKEGALGYWKACLTLARQLIKLFALALELPEDYFDSRTTYPGADGVFNYYPPSTTKEIEEDSVGLGSHTDLQLFTLLWQDQVGGLQVLKEEAAERWRWVKARPVEGTFVVNVGDFLMRLSNERFRSAVHRVYNRAEVERVSMPFFFGLNFNCVEGVIPTCTSEDNPAKYEPISCGDVSNWCQLRFKQEQDETNKVMAAQEKAPSAVIVST
ncbi:Clavaminate synthase-like protein [Saccharata proteae CBS 121410]|uniref:Clavaminate synthase-like protein n=1 Tax=Saccharata proteae CBS 121410 TaxID=1314787 RepID=A0A6A5YD69_9PEZI|nr:Clavaminate synthase-like protein [Saccharata proteae CBS 121410]